MTLVPAPADLCSVSCPACGRGMVVHQPEHEDPGRLLGVCEGCGQWAAIRFLAEGALILLGLPTCPEDAWDGPNEVMGFPAA